MRDGFSEEWLMWTTFATETMRRVIPQGLPAVQIPTKISYVRLLQAATQAAGA
jgi:hypothetical protein